MQERAGFEACGDENGQRVKMINKIVDTAAEALRDIRDGSVVMVGGFGSSRRTASSAWVSHPSRKTSILG